jgi:hypothetical protein
MLVSLHRLNEAGYQWLEALAADPVRRLPDHNQRVADRVIIKSAGGSWSAPWASFGPQHPHGVLAMKTRYGNELVQDACLLAPLALGLAIAYRHPPVHLASP